jgi:hypothetical protein
VASEALHQLVEHAIADYGFRQALLWGTDDVLASAGLDAAEGAALRERLLTEIEGLPVPVEPAERPAQLARLLALLDGAPS